MIQFVYFIFNMHPRCVLLFHLSYLCVQLNKIPIDEIQNELISVGVSLGAVKGIIEVLSLKSFPELEGWLLEN